MTATNVSIDSSPSREWETVDSMNETPASTDDDGDEFDDTLRTLQEGIEASIWVTHGVTSTRRRLALSQTAARNIQTIISVSGRELGNDEYAVVYTAILESLARAYREWKTTSRASTPESKVEEHLTRGAIPAPQPKPENTQERDLPPHMARPPCDPVLNQAIDQINVHLASMTSRRKTLVGEGRRPRG
jgi:hypothetical protein